MKQDKWREVVTMNREKYFDKFLCIFFYYYLTTERSGKFFRKKKFRLPSGKLRKNYQQMSILSST